MKIFQLTKSNPKLPMIPASSACDLSLSNLSKTSTKVQKELDKSGISSLIAGGVAVDLYGSYYLHSFEPRDHKDIDFLVEDWTLGSTLLNQTMSGLGFSIKPSIKHPNSRTFINGDIEIDFLGFTSTDDFAIGEYPVVSRSGLQLTNNIPIKTQPWIITQNNEALSVLNLKSLKDLKSIQLDFRNDKNTERDIRLLEDLLSAQIVN